MFCLLLFVAMPCSAVDFPLRWRWSNPAPHGGNVVDMAYSPVLSLGVQVAERGQIYTTANLDLWLPRDTFLTNAMRAVTFFGQRIIVTGENGVVLYADDVDHFQSGTLIDGATTDWLEAVTALPPLCVAAGDNGAIYTSTNGATWKRQNSGVTSWFRGAAAGAGNFVVVGEDGVILTSPNGTSWTARTSGTSQHLNRVHFANNGRFTAVGAGGVTLSSTNGGTNWFTETTGATNILQYVTSGGLDRLVDGVSEVRVQDSGIWSDELAKTNGPPNWTYYSAIGLLNFFLIAGQSGMQSEGYQVNGEPYFWLTPYDSVRNLLWDVTRLPSLYVAAGDYGTVMTSGNGVDWTPELVPTSATNTTFLGIGGNTNLLLAVGDSGTTLFSPNILTNVVITNGTGMVTQTVSSLGVLWFAGPKLTTNVLQGVGVLSNSLYVITGGNGVVFTSPDGTNWTPRASTTTNLLSSVTEWPGGLVATGDNGAIVSSPDGITWTQRLVVTTNWLYRVRWLNKTLITVGQNGTILTSPDASTWSARTSGTANWLTGAAFIGDTWFACGLSGTVLTSSNLVNWTPRGTLTKKPLYAAASNAGQFIVVGAEGVVLRSQVVPDLTPVSFLGYGRVSTNSLAYNIFLFGGKPDQRFTLDRSTNVVSSAWTAGPELEILDGSGTLYYIETLTGTNMPPIEYYRTTLAP